MPAESPEFKSWHLQLKTPKREVICKALAESLPVRVGEADLDHIRCCPVGEHVLLRRQMAPVQSLASEV